MNTNNEKIITPENKDKTITKLMSEIQKFNLDDFLHSKAKSTGAIGLITKKQMIITDTFSKKNNKSNYGSHIDSIIEICKYIYGISPSIADRPEELINWQNEIINDGNILIQFCAPNIMATIIWIPSYINTKQKEFLETLNEKIKYIVERDLEYYKDNSIIFACTYQGEYFELENSLDDLIYAINNNRNKRR